MRNLRISVLQAGSGTNGTENAETEYDDSASNASVSSPCPNEELQGQQIRMMLSNMQYEERKALGHRLEDMVLDCSFAGNDCNLT